MAVATMAGVRADDHLRSLLPDPIATFESWGDGPEGTLLPAELPFVARAVPKRVEDFRRGRVCARRALAAIGFEAVAIRVGDRRSPAWPDGVVGAITHCSGYCAAAVVRAGHGIAGIGIDAEPNRPLPRGVVDRTATRREQAWLARQDPTSVAWDTLLFSVKESIYKAWWPLARTWLDFHDAEVEVDVAAATFRASLAAAPPALASLTGRYTVVNGVIVTATAVSAWARREGTGR